MLACGPRDEPCGDVRRVAKRLVEYLLHRQKEIAEAPDSGRHFRMVRGIASRNVPSKRRLRRSGSEVETERLESGLLATRYSHHRARIQTAAQEGTDRHISDQAPPDRTLH